MINQKYEVQISIIIKPPLQLSLHYYYYHYNTDKYLFSLSVHIYLPQKEIVRKKIKNKHRIVHAEEDLIIG